LDKAVSNYFLRTNFIGSFPTLIIILPGVLFYYCRFCNYSHFTSTTIRKKFKVIPAPLLVVAAASLSTFFLPAQHPAFPQANPTGKYPF